jgi:hypothetical protein
VTGAEEGTCRRCGGMYFPAVISFWRSSSSNWAGVICCTTGGGDEGIDESGDKGLKGGKRFEGDCGGNW